MELGSEFDLDVNKLNYTDLNLFKKLDGMNYELYSSGRAAIRAVNKNVKGKVLLPEYICGSVIDCFEKEDLIFYRIKADFQIDYDDLKTKLNEDVKCIVIVHYFGAYHSIDQLMKIKQNAIENQTIIIEDITQSLFSNIEFIGDYVVSSIRKWLPIPNGGLLIRRLEEKSFYCTYDESTDNERVSGMILKNLFLNKHLDCNNEYREIFTRCEERIDNDKKIRRISDFSKFIISCQNIDDIIKIRKRNYYYLKEQLQKIGIIPACDIQKDACPLTLPIRVADRDEFRAYLMEHRIYCAVHWPFDGVNEMDRPMGKENAENLISLPIDQRYGYEELEYMASVISAYRGNMYVKNSR
ncbi:MAG: hypothetical protein HFH11_02905 [Dorea sp.]|jgi:hypothetical protein|nr:hypothetical protein [Dorea sp.]